MTTAHYTRYADWYFNCTERGLGHDMLVHAIGPPYTCMYCGQLVDELIDDDDSPWDCDAPLWYPVIVEEEELELP